MMKKQNWYWIWLLSVDGVGPATFWRLIKRFGSAEAVWNAGKVDLLNAKLDPLVVENIVSKSQPFRNDQYAKAINKYQILPLFCGEDGYPSRVAEIPNPPPILWVKGHKEWLNDYPKVAVVGARNTNVYGREVTEHFVYTLVSSGVTIVSGLAHGIDSYAHKQTLDISGGKTIGVLGGGIVTQILARFAVDKLFEQMLRDAVLVSQFDPFAHADASTFPQRNRIMAAFADAIVVTQAGRDSGALNTAMYANKLNRKVFVVPGDIDNERSVGCNALIAHDKAKLIVSPDEVLRSLFPLGANTERESVEKTDDEGQINDAKAVILRALRKRSARSLDTIVSETKISVSEALSVLGELELLGQIKTVGGKYSRV